MGALDGLAGLGATLIESLGTKMKLRRVNRDAGDRKLGSGSTQTKDYDVVGALGRWSESQLGVNGVETVGGLQVTVAPLEGITPRSNDIVILGDTQATVIDVLPVYAGDLPAVYELRCKGV